MLHSFGNQGVRVGKKSAEARNPWSLKSSGNLCSLWWFGMTCPLLVLVVVSPLCSIKSTVSTVTYQEIVEHFMLQSDSFFHQDLASDLTVCRISYNWAWRANQFIWPEAHGESMEHCEAGDEKHPAKKYRQAEDFYQRNLCFSNTSASML